MFKPPEYGAYHMERSSTRVLTKSDTTIAKNYLDAEEDSTLELLVGQYLDFAELQARRRKIMYMKDWIEKLHSFLELNDQEILLHAGTISAELAKRYRLCRI